MESKNGVYKKMAIAVVVGLSITAGTVYYFFNQPHRDIQSVESDFSYSSSQIVNEYLENFEKANQKYLDEEGESKVLEISGTISSISEDFNYQKVILLKNETDKAGVSCTMLENTLDSRVGDNVKIKGVIIGGASFDEDLNMFENVTMDKCTLVK